MIAISFCLPLGAEVERGLLQNRLGYRETQENFFMRTYELEVRNHRRDLLWEYQGQQPNQFDFGLDTYISDTSSPDYQIKGQRYRALIGYQKEKNWYFEARLGAHRYQAKNAAEKIEHTTPSGELRVRHRTEKTRQRIDLEYDQLYTKLQLPGAIDENLRTLSLTYQGEYSPREVERYSSRVIYRWYSDENERFEGYLDYARQIHSSPWVPWVGIGVSHLSTQRNINGYWTPRSQSSWGPRLAWFYWRDETFSLSFYSSIAHYYDASSKNTGLGHYTALVLYLGDRNKVHGLIELVRMDSRQDSQWHENNVFLSLNLPL